MEKKLLNGLRSGLGMPILVKQCPDRSRGGYCFFRGKPRWGTWRGQPSCPFHGNERLGLCPLRLPKWLELTVQWNGDTVTLRYDGVLSRKQVRKVVQAARMVGRVVRVERDPQ